MSDVLLEKFLKNRTVLIDGEVYQLVGNYAEIPQTSIDYELQHIRNTNDEVTVSKSELVRNLQNKWKIVEL